MMTHPPTSLPTSLSTIPCKLVVSETATQVHRLGAPGSWGVFSSETCPSCSSGLTMAAAEIACHALQLAGTRKQQPTGFKRFHEPEEGIRSGITQLPTQDVSPDPQQPPHSVPFAIVRTVRFGSSKVNPGLQACWVISPRTSFPCGALLTNVRMLTISPTCIWSCIYIYVTSCMNPPITPSPEDF